ncbi:hypothetical protein HOO68_03830 [Candidatus Gracilibacteria bacterium]|nr:hypothetical protein [Candidatus Gracilibacteria bacterium]
MAFSLDRDGASRRLGVSSRTIDRHIQAERIRTRRIGKKMFLEEDDVEALRMADPARREEDYTIVESSEERKVPEIVTPIKEMIDPKQNNVALAEIVRIYEDARSLIAEKDATIQTLSYKLGKIESELANSIPAMEYKKTTFLLESAKSKSDSDAEVLTKKITTLESEVNKRNSALVTLVILFILVLGFSVIFVLFGDSLK